MSPKPHIKLNTKLQFETPVKLEFNYGYGPEEEEHGNPNASNVKSYASTAEEFRYYYGQFSSQRKQRITERNREINVPEHIFYVKIEFLGQFDIPKYFSKWIADLQLTGVQFLKFNTEVIFAVTSQSALDSFLKQIENFIHQESGEKSGLSYTRKLLFIKSFELLTTDKILNSISDTNLVNLKLPDFPLNEEKVTAIIGALVSHLEGNKINFYIDTDTNDLELYNVDPDDLKVIVQNFDIVLNVTSALATLIRPTKLGLPERSYGFEVVVPEGELPIVGIVDTGISAQTPLDPIIIKDETFNLTNSSVLMDGDGNDSGHGTGVAALAALGKHAYGLKHRGEIPADAKLLSIKILDDNSAYISHKSVLKLLEYAKGSYPKMKIFVLTVCYATHKRLNENHSKYAYELDKFAYFNDCLVIISTSNNEEAWVKNNSYNLAYFNEEVTNLCVPADSMNNITVGASAHSLKDGPHCGISTSHEYPTLYSRRGSWDLSTHFTYSKFNKNYFKPDVIECGGDYEFSSCGQYIGQSHKASIDILSANPKESFYPSVGTSYSAPLVANLAAKILRNYPGLRAQTIKALIINGASLERVRFEGEHTKLLNRVAGHGVVDHNRSVLSDDGIITFVIEDQIEPEKIAVYPLNFPNFLINENLNKKSGILKVTATLCFDFEPVFDNQLAYCPIHMAFCFYRNHTAEEIQTKEKDIKSSLKSNLNWSQNGRFKSKPIPSSNSQKLAFNVDVANLKDENCIFKLAVNCRILQQLIPGSITKYNKPHNFSVAITIEEKFNSLGSNGKLYDEMVACNEIVNIASASLQGEAFGEAEA